RDWSSDVCSSDLGSIVQILCRSACRHRHLRDAQLVGIHPTWTVGLLAAARPLRESGHKAGTLARNRVQWPRTKTCPACTPGAPMDTAELATIASDYRVHRTFAFI